MITTAHNQMNYPQVMSTITKIHDGKTPTRIHFIAEWIEHRQKKPADVARALGVDKSLISKWINKGVVPTEKHLIALAGYLECEEINSLFRHPMDDWLAKLLKNRTPEEVERIKTIVNAAFSIR